MLIGICVRCMQKKLKNTQKEGSQTWSSFLRPSRTNSSLLAGGGGPTPDLSKPCVLPLLALRYLRCSSSFSVSWYKFLVLDSAEGSSSHNWSTDIGLFWKYLFLKTPFSENCGASLHGGGCPGAPFFQSDVSFHLTGRNGVIFAIPSTKAVRTSQRKETQTRGNCAHTQVRHEQLNFPKKTQWKPVQRCPPAPPPTAPPWAQGRGLVICILPSQDAAGPPQRQGDGSSPLCFKTFLWNCGFHRAVGVRDVNTLPEKN